MKICLVDPPGLGKGLNVGLGYLASSLLSKGHQVRVIDLHNAANAEKTVMEVKGYDIVGISIKSFSAKSAVEVSKMMQPKVLICGGPHITLDGYNFLTQNPNFHIGVLGEAEETICLVADFVQNGGSLRGIKGIIWRDKHNLVSNLVSCQKSDRALVTGTDSHSPLFSTDLNSLPFPNYEVFDSFNGTITMYPILTSRGCPYRCTYCCVGQVSGKKWRSREPINVIEELKLARLKYNSRMFSVLDDNFTEDMERAKEICRLLVQHKINMKWSCSNGIRANRVDEELAKLMKESGCEFVSLGIESLDEEVYENIKKGERLEDIRQAIDIFRDHRIRVTGSFIVGLPGDNLKRARASVELAKRLKLSVAGWGMLVPYPGTEVWDWVNQNARILRDWRDGFHGSQGTKVISVFETNDFLERERVEAYTLANIKCKAYGMLFDGRLSVLQNCLNILKLILKHDANNIPLHLLYILRNIKPVWQFVRRFYKK